MDLGYSLLVPDGIVYHTKHQFGPLLYASNFQLDLS